MVDCFYLKVGTPVCSMGWDIEWENKGVRCGVKARMITVHV